MRRTQAFLITSILLTASATTVGAFDPFAWLRLDNVEPIPTQKPFIPASVEPLYSDVYLEYCACPADAEAEYVITREGERIEGDPDSCPHELTEAQIFGVD